LADVWSVFLGKYYGKIMDDEIKRARKKYDEK
jgi:hypothetical protein